MAVPSTFRTENAKAPFPPVDPARKALKDYVRSKDADEYIFDTPPTNHLVSRHFREPFDHVGLQHEDIGTNEEDAPFEPVDNLGD